METEKSPHKRTCTDQSPNFKIFLYIPNIIGYIRLGLLITAFSFFSSTSIFIGLYCLSAILDAFDGITARKLNQCSIYGAWLDVAIDNTSRGLLWVHIHPSLYVVSVIEWLAFVCNHQLGADWRELLARRNGDKYQPKNTPTIVTHIMRNNFRNFWGIWSIAGLHVFPISIAAMQYNFYALTVLPKSIVLVVLVLLATGRVICFIAEFWSIWVHILVMLVAD